MRCYVCGTKLKSMHNNLIRLIGYIGKDLSAAKTTNGNNRVGLRVATHYSTADDKGQRVYHTVWHDVVAWGTVADFAERNFVKGSKVLVEGAMEYRIFPDSAGHIRYQARVSAFNLVNLDR